MTKSDYLKYLKSKQDEYKRLGFSHAASAIFAAHYDLAHSVAPEMDSRVRCEVLSEFLDWGGEVYWEWFDK